MSITQEEIDQDVRDLQAHGFKVYKRSPSDAYGIFTSGDKLAYYQRTVCDGVSISTVHKPSRQVGTGFGVVDRWADLADIKQCNLGFLHAPEWAVYAGQVRKYSGIDEYTAESMFHAAYQEQPCLVVCEEAAEDA